MAMYGFFAAPILGMMTQSSAFGTISQNITNMNTGGYKAADTRFSTILASTFDSNSDIGGVRAVRKNLISNQGNILSSTNDLDLAISGHGLYKLNTQLDGSGDTLYTRDGGFQIFSPQSQQVTGEFRSDGSFNTLNPSAANSVTITASEAYLVDKNFNYLHAWQPDTAGNFNVQSDTVPIRIDRFAFNSDAAASTTASLAGNLPVTDGPLKTRVFNASIYDSSGTLRTIQTVFTKDPTTPQRWSVGVETGSAADTISSGSVPDRTPFIPLIPDTAGSTNEPTDYPAAQLISFDTSGQPSTTSLSFAITFSGGSTASVTMDLSNMTAIGENFLFFDFQKNGRGPGDLESFSFDELGNVNGQFTNGVIRSLYRIPLATFANPDGLEVVQGNRFAETLASGTVNLRQAGIDGFGLFVPFAQETSNVNLATEFNRMILAQQAYNSSATVFKTVDEMTQAAAQLKR